MATSDLAPQAREQVIRGRLRLLSAAASTPAELWGVVAELIKRLPGDLDFLTKENARLRTELETVRSELELTRFAALPPEKPPSRLPPPLIIEEVSQVEDLSDRMRELSDLFESVAEDFEAMKKEMK